jgi:hypothetical protein
MITHFKATRVSGLDFRTGTVDYGAALLSGEILRHTAPKRVKDDPSTYLSVSVAPADCTGMSWPCRLFRVKPVGRTLRGTPLPNKRACAALRVVEELPAWQALGPNGQALAALITQSQSFTPDQSRRLAAAWGASWDASRDASRAASRDASRAAAGAASRDAAWAASRAAAGGASRAAAAGAAAWAYLVRDLITPEQFHLLAGPWISVMGEPS